MSFFDQFPGIEILEALEPEELAGRILNHLIEEDRPRYHMQGLVIPPERQDLWEHRDQIHVYIAEAWAWLEGQGLLVPEPGPNGRGGYCFISRKGMRLRGDPDFGEYVQALSLNRELLHPRIELRVWPPFVRGEYDVAVFQAMKALEVWTREAAGYDNKERGAPMLRKAFHKENGPLMDPDLEPGEREALCNMIAGAYGYFRNPAAHRHVPMDHPAPAVEIIMFASHVMRIIEDAEERAAGFVEQPDGTFVIPDKDQADDE